MPFPAFDDDQPALADAGTAADLLRKKLPGLFADSAAPSNGNAGAIPLFGAPKAASVPEEMPVPDITPAPNPLAQYLPWLRPQQQQLQRPALTTPTGQIAPGATKGQALGVLLQRGIMGAIAGQSAVEQSVARSGGRTRAGFGTAAMAGFEAPAQQTATAQALQRGGLENQQLAQQVQAYPQAQALGAMEKISTINKNQSTAVLNQAKTEVERYTSSGGLMWDLKAPGGPAPIQGTAAGEFVPATAEMAALAGIPVGSMVRTETASKLQALAKTAPPSSADKINALHKSIYQTVFPGRELPPELTFNPGDSLEDYKRIDSGLEKLQKAQGTQLTREGTQAQRETNNEMRRQTFQLAQNAQADREEKQGLQWVIWQEPSGRTVAGPLSLAKKSGAQNPATLDTRDVQGVMDSRQAVNLINKRGNPKDPTTWGVRQLIDSLDKDGKLGIGASRLNSFLAGQVGYTPGDDPRIISLLDKSQLLMTLSMKAHFGASGGRSPQMLQHFLDLANAKKMNAQTLRSGTSAVGDYMSDRAMLPSGSGGGNGATANAPKAPTFADWKRTQGQR